MAKLYCKVYIENLHHNNVTQQRVVAVAVSILVNICDCEAGPISHILKQIWQINKAKV